MRGLSLFQVRVRRIGHRRASANRWDVPDARRAGGRYDVDQVRLASASSTYDRRAKANDAAAFEWFSPARREASRRRQRGSRQVATRGRRGKRWTKQDHGPAGCGRARDHGQHPSSALVKAEPADRHRRHERRPVDVQRVNTKGGVAPLDTCSAQTVGMEKQSAVPGRLRVLQDVGRVSRLTNTGGGGLNRALPHGGTGDAHQILAYDRREDAPVTAPSRSRCSRERA